MGFALDTLCPNGLITLGVKHYGDPTNPISFYIKHYDLADKETIWDIWRKKW